MILDKSLILQNRTSSDITYDNEGIAVEIWTANNTTILVNRQPYLGNEFSANEYGYSKTPLIETFYTEVNTDIQEGISRFIDGAEKFDVKRVKKFPNHYEVIVAPLTE